MYPIGSPMQRLLAKGDWGAYRPLMDAFLSSPYGAALGDALARLNRGALYMSHVHGLGHIERTMLHGAMCAKEEELDAEDTGMLLDMCAYHDTGRENDWLDPEHGHRAAKKLAALTGRSGAALIMMQACVDAHSRSDKYLDETLARYAPADMDKTRRMAELLKDADGLDRVRIQDLDPRYLRRDASRARADFARELFARYRALEQTLEDAPAAEGFELAAILALKRFVDTSFAEGRSCAQTALLALGNLTGHVIPAALLASHAAVGEECGLLTGARAFLGACGHTAHAEALTARFKAQYGDTGCASLRSHGAGCTGFAVDGILFALQYIQENKIMINGAGAT